MSDNGKIPFLDLVTPHLALEEELLLIFRSALRTAVFVGGEMVDEFEQEFARFCGVQYCVGVGSGTDALRFALIAAGVQPGNTVITVPNTFIATTEAISQAGAVPDFVEIDERTYNMDASKLHEYLETRCYIQEATGKLLNRATGRPVTAVVPVHLYGQMANMDRILDVAEQHKLVVIEDACQAHGAEYFSGQQNRWKGAGSIGRAAAFSFYPGKNLGACGEAGAVTTNDPLLSEKVRMLRDHGQRQKYQHEVEGYNGRLDGIQAGILRTKLHYLVDWNRKRREKARNYNELLSSEVDVVTVPYEPSWARAVYHLYVIRVQNRDQLQAHLAQANIASQIHYPTPLHLQKAYTGLGYKRGDFPVSEKTASEILSLPMYPSLELDQQERIVQKVCEFVSVQSASRWHPSLQPASLS